MGKHLFYNLFFQLSLVSFTLKKGGLRSCRFCFLHRKYTYCKWVACDWFICLNVCDQQNRKTTNCSFQIWYLVFGTTMKLDEIGKIQQTESARKCSGVPFYWIDFFIGYFRLLLCLFCFLREIHLRFKFIFSEIPPMTSYKLRKLHYFTKLVY